MKVKLVDVISSVNAIKELNGLTLPFSTALALSKISSSVDEVVKTFNDLRIKLLKEYSEKDEKGEPIIKNDNYDISVSGQQKITEKLSIEIQETVEIAGDQLSTDLFKDSKLTAQTLTTLAWLFKDK